MVKAQQGKPSPMAGKKHTEETKQKMRKPHGAMSEEFKQMLKNRVVSDETKQRLRELQLGKTVSEETRKKMIISQKARRQTEQLARIQ